MADITWTIDQEAAINAPIDEPTVVSAAAGSGKTALLVERVVRKLRDRTNEIPADRIAIMTFTRNAAEEFRQRMSAAIEKAAEDVTDEADRNYLNSQLIKFRSAPIETINAFALRLLKESPEIFGLPYSFSVIEEGKAEILRRKALEDVLNEFYSDSFDADTRERLFKTFSFQDDEELTSGIIKIYRAVTSLPDRTALMQRWSDAYGDENLFYELFLKDVEDKYTELKASLKNSLEAMEDYRDELQNRAASAADKNDPLVKSVKAMTTTISNDTEAYNTFESLYNAAMSKFGFDRIVDLLNISFYQTDPQNSALVKKPNASYPTDAGIKAEFMLRREPIKNANKSINSILSLFDLSFKAPEKNQPPPKHLGDLKVSILDDINRQKPVIQAFLGLVMSFDEKYSELKLNEGYVDFSDCEKLLLERLTTDEEYRWAMTKRYDCLIIDEFQDTNAIQYEIFRAISDNGKNLFFVGDVKQAIYGFRGGDSSIMAGLCGGNEGFVTKPLNCNFRSRSEVINSVNAMFCGFMTPTYGDVDYEKDGQLTLGAKYDSGKAVEDYYALTETDDADSSANLSASDENNKDGQLTLDDLDKSDKAAEITIDTDDYSTELHLLDYEIKGDEAYTSEARYVAARIKSMVDSGFIVKGKDGPRPCNYGDFGILMRAKKHFGLYRRELELLNIPVTSERGKDYLDTDEVALIISLLKIIDNPMLNQETSVVLMSPLYMFSVEDMTRLRLGLMGIDEKLAQKAGIDLEPLKEQNAYSSLYHCLNSASNGYKIYSSASSDKDSENSEKNEKEERRKAYAEAIEKLRQAGAVYADSEDKSQPESWRKCKRFINDLVKFRAYMANNSVESLIGKIYDDTDFFALLSVYEDKEQRMANIRLLLRYVSDFESSGGGSLSDFLRYIDTLSYNLQRKKTTDVLNSASTSEGNPNSVKLMSFHASKGLEFPICIISELESRFNRRDTYGTLVFHRDKGPALIDVDIEKQYKTKCFNYNITANAESQKLIGEEMRLLYVAMTRAREKLIMVMRESPERLAAYKDLKYSAAIEKNSPMIWVLYSFMRYYNGNLPEKGKHAPDGKLMGLSSISLNIYHSSTPLPEPQTILPQQTEAKFTADEATVKKLADRITAKYAHEVDTQARSKYVVTEVAHMISAQDKQERSGQAAHDVVYIKSPSFTDKEIEISGKVVGDAFHHTMEHYPFGKNISAEAALKELADSKKINETEYLIMMKNVEKLKVFLNSELCRRMLAADSCEREYEFFAEVPARDIYVDAEGETAIQGRIDMFFTEGDGIVLVDYKSDSKRTIFDELPAYKKQLMIYGSILPLMTGKTVKEVYIYSFSLGKEIRVDTLTDEDYMELISDENRE